MTIEILINHASTHDYYISTISVYIHYINTLNTTTLQNNMVSSGLKILLTVCVVLTLVLATLVVAKSKYTNRMYHRRKYARSPERESARQRIVAELLVSSPQDRDMIRVGAKLLKISSERGLVQAEGTLAAYERRYIVALVNRFKFRAGLFVKLGPRSSADSLKLKNFGYALSGRRAELNMNNKIIKEMIYGIEESKMINAIANN